MVTFTPPPITSSSHQSKLDVIRMTAPSAVAFCSVRGRVLQRSEVGDEELRARDVRKRQRYKEFPHAYLLRRSKNTGCKP